MLGKKPSSKFLILLLYHITQKSIQINGNAWDINQWFRFTYTHMGHV